MKTDSKNCLRASIKNGELVFDIEDGVLKALENGYFLLEIPSHIQVQHGRTLCRQFYRPKVADSQISAYQGFRELENMYFDREHYQTEHILVDRPARERHFPEELRNMADAMDEVGLLVLRTVLEKLSVDKSFWSSVTGGASVGKGTHWFAASHYRPERQQLGCAPHKDTGFVTILYVEQEGLEAYTGTEWESIDPVHGWFIVNFGASLEMLTARLAYPARAIFHRVRHCSNTLNVEDRFSFATFVNSSPSSDLYQISANGAASVVMSVAEFLRNFNDATWNDRHKEFGILNSGDYADIKGGGDGQIH